MDKVHDKDISVDKDRWITWLEIDQSKSPLDIDLFLLPTISFWNAIQTNCVPACCGINAFTFWPDDIQNAKQQLKDQLLRLKFETLRTALSKTPNVTFNSSHLNNLFDKRVFLALLEHIISNL